MREVRIRFEAVACFDLSIMMSDSAIEMLEKICDRNETPVLREGHPIHKMLLVDRTIQPDDFDYIDRNVDLEEIEFEITP